MIRLKNNLTLKVKKPVSITNKSYNMPSRGTLTPNTIVEVCGGPTRLSDVPFKIVTGGGSITVRTLSRTGSEELSSKDIVPGDSYFFNQGHDTVAPYDYGTLDSDYYEIVK